LKDVAARAGFDGTFTKPVDPDALMLRLEGGA